MSCLAIIKVDAEYAVAYNNNNYYFVMPDIDVIVNTIA